MHNPIKPPLREGRILESQVGSILAKKKEKKMKAKRQLGKEAKIMSMLNRYTCAHAPRCIYLLLCGV